MNTLALALVAAVAAVSPADLIGNGRLTAVADRFGSVSVCRWPGPGMNNQLGGSTKWGIYQDGKVTWLVDGAFGAVSADSWRPAICSGRINLADAASAVTETFVAADADLLVCRLKLVNAGNPPDLVWHADFSPSSVLLPELAPIADLAPRDFAAYVKDNRIYQFRPAGPGSKEIRAAAAGEWDMFADSKGVWVVMASPQAVSASCGLAGAKSAVARGATGAAGDCDAAFLIRTSSAAGSREAAVFAAFGETRAEAESALDSAMDTGADALRDRAADLWAGPRATTSLRLQKDIATVRLAIDRSTGAFARDPAFPGRAALCHTRDCAWASMALDLAGREEEAGEVLQFVASTVRKEQRRGKPIGSLPVTVYGNGTDALPHLALDADAPAFALGAFWKHAMAVEDYTRRNEFLTSIWSAAVLMADFLDGWTDSRNREPLYSFDLRQGRDRQGPGRLLTTYMGIDAALRIAGAMDLPKPDDWARRKVELDALIRFQLVDRREKAWKPGPILPYWHDMMAEDWAFKGSPLPAWDDAVAEMLDSGEPAEAAAAAALVWRGDTVHAGRLSAAVETAYLEATNLNALSAAQRIIADFEFRISD